MRLWPWVWRVGAAAAAVAGVAAPAAGYEVVLDSRQQRCVTEELEPGTHVRLRAIFFFFAVVFVGGGVGLLLACRELTRVPAELTGGGGATTAVPLLPAHRVRLTRHVFFLAFFFLFLDVRGAGGQMRGVVTVADAAPGVDISLFVRCCCQAAPYQRHGRWFGCACSGS